MTEMSGEVIEEDGGASLRCSDQRGGVVSSNGIYSLVFIDNGVAANRRDGAAMFEAAVWLDGDRKGTKQLRAVSNETERRTPMGLDPRVTSEVTVVRQPHPMMDNESNSFGGEEKRRDVSQKDRLEPGGLRLCMR